MKRKYSLLLVMLGVLLLGMSGCDDKGIQIDADGTLKSTAKPLQKNQASVKKEHKGTANPEVRESLSPETEKTDGVDIDLTKMDSTMVYATVYQIMTKPNDYVGKVIRAKGPYRAVLYEVDKKYYNYVIVKDATACCETGLEFIWEDGSHVYPDEYPKNDVEIEVTGTFEVYQDDGDTKYYGRLANSTMKLVKDN